MNNPRMERRQQLLDKIRLFNKYVFNRLTLTFAGGARGPFSVIVHTGRKSGKIYRTPVLATSVGEALVIPLSYGEGVDWLQNLLAKGSCQVLFEDQRMTGSNPEIIDRNTALELLPEKRRKLFERHDIQKFLYLRVSSGGI
jgi:deazaflavin-dependent oxidoreductase (nitroreductase family)